MQEQKKTKEIFAGFSAGRTTWPSVTLKGCVVVGRC